VKIPKKSTRTWQNTIDIIYIAFLAWMKNIKRITSFSLIAGMFLVAALATSSLTNKHSSGELAR
jgi:hypothetical protein